MPKATKKLGNKNTTTEETLLHMHTTTYTVQTFACGHSQYFKVNYTHTHTLLKNSHSFPLLSPFPLMLPPFKASLLAGAEAFVNVVKAKGEKWVYSFLHTFPP